MSRIQQLPTSVVTKIAAGEVIERPSSVVKELLENSIDAGSTRIDIEIDQGGSDRIQVVDNGCGIYPDDLPLAFASHATSKLRDADDLFRIGTLGFRGEALASIGGVAQVTLQSRPHDLPAGSEITCHGGELAPVKAWNGSPGTRIEVKHLFFNTPVRRKFLRTTSTELGHISESFTKLALAHPSLHMTLRHNGKKVYEVTATNDVRERIGLFFGKEVYQHIYPIETERNGVRLWGYVADPQVERGNAKWQYLFLNGRWIRDRSLGHALQEAFRGLLMTGRYAIAFLFLEMPPDLVDVNVHPTKSEVRFREGQYLYSMVLGTIRQRLSAENLTARLKVTSTLDNPQQQHSTGSFFAPMPAHPATSQPLPPPPVFPEPPQTSPPQEPFVESASGLVADTPEPMPATAEELASAFNVAPANGEVAHSPPSHLLLPREDFKAIQLYNAYLVLETPEGMLVIDQHALHERILFEQFKRRIKEGSLETQQLLIPEPIELTAEQAALTLEYQKDLAALGLDVEDFGGGTLLLRSYPAILGNRSPHKILKAVVDHLTSKDRAPTREQMFNNLLSLMACHSAVRAGDPLTQEQIAALVAQRDLADDTHHCPHGRPTALLFSRQDLDRQFGRV